MFDEYAFVFDVSPVDQERVELESEDTVTVKSTLSPAQISVTDAVKVFSCIVAVTANQFILSHPPTVCDA